MNNYIKEYQDLRDQGYNDLEAFGLVSNRVALIGSMDDLKAVRDYHMQDFLSNCEEVFNEGMESKNERVAG